MGTWIARSATVEVPLRRWSSRALLIAQLAVALLIARNWAYVTTYRLFLDHRNAAAVSGATQQFDIEGSRVVPLIVTRGADRVAFATDVGRDSTIHAVVRPATPTRPADAPTAPSGKLSDVSLSEGRPARPASWAIEWHRGAMRRVLAQGTIIGPTSIVCAFPTGTGVIELVSDGPVTWVDPRVVRDLHNWPHLFVLAGLGLCWIVSTRRTIGDDSVARRGETPVAAFRVAAAALGLGAAFLVSEAALRALGDMTPSGIASERHDLGEMTRDPRWIETARYGRRLRPDVDALNEWRYGDIVRMGYIPTPAVESTLHRFVFHTDAEGFRNRSVRERFDVAALGDSFTDAMTMTAEASWPARLERILQVSAQNYGTAGFGPQQELLVLKDFVSRHRPRVVVLAFFAGNDLFDAEAFDAFQRTGGAQPRVQQGWRIKDVVSRADTWFVVSAVRAGARWVSSHEATAAAATVRSSSSRSSTSGLPSRRPEEPDGRAAIPSFDRGMFELSVAGSHLSFAFMPPYLNTLNFSEEELAARPGWRLTREAIAEMKDVSASFGAQFVVMFVPFKSQVYLPLLESRFSPEALGSAFRFYLEAYGRDVDIHRFHANRLAQNQLLSRFCERTGIPFLDATEALERRVGSGENMYFPDESHLNEAGESVLAEMLAAFLNATWRDVSLRPLSDPRSR